jgi:hypothetical protein
MPYPPLVRNLRAIYAETQQTYSTLREIEDRLAPLFDIPCPIPGQDSRVTRGAVADLELSLGARGGVLTQYITNTLQGNGQRT